MRAAPRTRGRRIFSAGSSQRRRRNGRPLQLEPLESRCLLSVAPALFGAAVSPQIQEGESAHLMGNLSLPAVSGTFHVSVDWGDGSPAQHLNVLDGPTGYWPFNGNANDASGVGRNLGLTGGADFASGLLGQALDLHADASQYALRPQDDNAYDFCSSTFTLQVWVNFNNAGGNQTILGKSSGMYYGRGWTLGESEGYYGNTITFGWSPVVGTPSFAVTVQPLTTGVWYQIVVSRNGSNLSMYFDGSLATSMTYAYPMPDSDAPLVLGRTNLDSYRNFPLDGRLDEVAIWDRALGASDVAALYNNGTGNAVLVGPQISSDHVYAENGHYTATVTVTGDDGSSTSTPLTVVVNNVAPTATLVSNWPANEGSPAVGFVDASDPSAADMQAGLHYSFAPTQDALASDYASAGDVATYTFADDGTYTIWARVLDKDNAYTDYQATVVVNNVDPALGNVAVTPTIDEGQFAHLTGNIIDPGTLDAHAVTVDWGDGSALQTYRFDPGVTSFDVMHQYLDNRPGNAPYTLNFSVADEDGGVGSIGLYTPVKVKNIFPVLGMPDQWLGVGDTLFFGATEFSGDGVGDSNHELWKSDGTEAGTVRVKDINPGPDGSVPMMLTNVDGRLFFTAYDPEHGRELWTSDGTEAGTHVLDICPGPQDSGATQLTASQGLLFFAAQDPVLGGYRLWKSDGTEAGTTMVAAHVQPVVGGPFLDGWPQNWATLGGDLFFTGTTLDGSQDVELWKTDGTATGTVLVKDIFPGPEGSMPVGLTNVNGRLFFMATDPEHGLGLWKSDGTTAGTTLVKDIFPGLDSSFPTWLTAAGERVFFCVYGPRGTELWGSDGTAAGTQKVALPADSSPWQFAAAGDNFYFAAIDPSDPSFHVHTLWKVSVVEPLQVVVKNVPPDVKIVGGDLLDPTFGDGGLVLTGIHDSVNSLGHQTVVVQPDGRVLIGGSIHTDRPTSTDFVMVRYNPDGSLDPSFGDGGVARIDFGTAATGPTQDYGGGMILLPDGRIVAVVGSWFEGSNGFDFGLAVCRPDGTLDPNFGDSGRVLDDLGGDEMAWNVALQTVPSGTTYLVVAGYKDNHSVLARYDLQGHRDIQFGTGGIVVADFGNEAWPPNALAIQPDGRIVVASTVRPNDGNSHVIVARYNVNGDPDDGGPSDSTPGDRFGADGWTAIDFGGQDNATALALQSDSRIVVTGYSWNPDGTTGNDIALARLNADGSLDSGGSGDSTPGDQFGSGGTVVTDFGHTEQQAQSVTVDGRGRILVAGRTGNPDGGYEEFALVRYNADGGLDTSFGEGGLAAIDFGGVMAWAYNVALQPDGKAVIVGMSYEAGSGYGLEFAVARCLLDTSPEGSPIALAGKVSDPGTLDTFSYDWKVTKDGALVAASNAPTLNFTPDDNGTYEVTRRGL